MKQRYQQLLERTFSRLKALFLHGIFTLFPAVITFALLKFLFTLIKAWLAPIYNAEPAFLHYIPHSEIWLTLILILATGLLYELFLQHVIHHIESSVLKKIPLLSMIYFGLKQLTKALTAHGKNSLQQVMLVPFPAPGTYSIGFLTSDKSPTWTQEFSETYLSVFVPHTPNPTSGFYILVPASKCIPLTITRQEAMTLVISGGIIAPPPHAIPILKEDNT
jgi:uncharacterized membrane protein